MLYGTGMLSLLSVALGSILLLKKIKLHDSEVPKR